MTNPTFTAQTCTNCGTEFYLMNFKRRIPVRERLKECRECAKDKDVEKTKGDQTMTYQLIVMSFDGDYQTERPEFESTDDAWDYAGNLGSKWFFYPFHFVIDQSGEVASAPELMNHLEGMTVEDVAEHFKEVAATPEAQGVDADRFAFMV